MSSEPRKLRRYVRGNASPGTDTNSPSPMRNAATWVCTSFPDVEPFGSTGFCTAQPAK
jgi:hypothetical protein